MSERRGGERLRETPGLREAGYSIGVRRAFRRNARPQRGRLQHWRGGERLRETPGLREAGYSIGVTTLVRLLNPRSTGIRRRQTAG